MLFRSRLTGLSADTLRMWERRYGFPRPMRTKSGVRVYSASDVERLSLVARALAVGFRAGDALRLDGAALADAVARVQSASSAGVEAAPPGGVDLVAALAADDIEAVRGALRQAVSQRTQAAGPDKRHDGRRRRQRHADVSARMQPNTGAHGRSCNGLLATQREHPIVPQGLHPRPSDRCIQGSVRPQHTLRYGL